MKQYRNRLTGTVIEVNGTLSGEHWEEVPAASPSAASEKKPEPKKTPRKKKEEA